MKGPEARREVILDRMADYVLSEGLSRATLRPLAAAAEISDRMLLYYFVDKDELITAILERIAARLLNELNEIILPGRSFDTLLKEVWSTLNSERHRPYMAIWYDLSALAARGLEPHRTIAGAIADGYLAWVADRLDRQANQPPFNSAPLFLVSLQGMYLLNAIGRPKIVDEAKGALLSGHI